MRRARLRPRPEEVEEGPEVRSKDSEVKTRGGRGGARGKE